MTVLCLGLAALVLRWVVQSPERLGHTEQANGENQATEQPLSATPAVAPVAEVPFRLSLSAAARRVEMLDAAGERLWYGEQGAIDAVQGTWARLPENVVLRVTWVNAGAPRYFAKLVIDPPGRRSLTHVFDAEGEIDDLWELP